MAETDSTQLNQDFGMSIDDVKNGEPIEFPAVEKPKRERGPLYRSSLVDPLVADVMTDLRQAYMDIDHLNDDNAKYKQQVQQLNGQVQKLQQEAQVNQDAENKIKDLDKHLSEMQKQASERKDAYTKAVQEANDNAAKYESQIKGLKQTISQQEGQLNSDKSLIDDLNRQVTELKENGGSAEELQAKEAELQATKESLTKDVNEVLASLRQKFQLESN